MHFRCFDLETTGTDVATCEVVQAAVVDAPMSTVGGVFLDAAETHEMFFRVSEIPRAASQVHGIVLIDDGSFDRPVTVVPEDAPAFGSIAESFAASLVADDVVVVTYNGCGFDLPVVARYVAQALGQPAASILQRLQARHIDVMRVWARARAVQQRAPWKTSEGSCAYAGHELMLTADMFAGILTAAHGFWLGEGFGDAHNASADCTATLRVLDAMLTSGFVDVETAVRWSAEPLPGDVDFDGVFKWDGDQAVLSIGKHKGTPLEDVPASYLRWMVSADFSAATKTIVLDFTTRNIYPQRAYESEK
jgi:DNA polymerase III epsilon subunit-like protein